MGTVTMLALTDYIIMQEMKYNGRRFNQLDSIQTDGNKSIID